MSAEIERQVNVELPAASQISGDELSELDDDGDGSSSLSDIEDKDADQDDEGTHLSDNSGGADEEEEGDEEEEEEDVEDNDSEAETERLENSPEKLRKRKNVILGSKVDSQRYNRNSRKMQDELNANNYDNARSQDMNGLGTEDGVEEGDDEEEGIDNEDEAEEDDDEHLSEADETADDSPKRGSNGERERDTTTAATSLEDSSGEGKSLLVPIDNTIKKRKRSIMPDIRLGEEIEEDEPVRKRTGSILGHTDGVVEPTSPIDDDRDLSPPPSIDTSDEEEAQDDEEVNHAKEEVVDPVSLKDSADPKKDKGMTWKKQREAMNGTKEPDDDVGNTKNVENPSKRGDDITVDDGAEIEDNADVEADDDLEIALRNEEELKRKGIALDQLSAIERHFSTFRERLFDDRLAQLEHQEAMLREDPPKHPEYLAMLKCIDERRDERLRIHRRLKEYELETLDRSAIAKRSQVFGQYYQTVRELREKALEKLGEQWYNIQHDRRGYAGSVPDYGFKLPARKQQLLHQAAYNKEVSILSGIAKYVGFPAAPSMASATASEFEEDMEKIHSRSQQQVQTQRSHHQGLPLQDLAAIRAANSTSRFKPAEEKFIEQTPWANPQHPSHAHLLQRQNSGHLPPRKESPTLVPQPSQSRRQSHHHGASPIAGTFSGNPTAGAQANGNAIGGRTSPLNPFSNPSHTHKIAPSPLGSRQASGIPDQLRHPHAERSQDGSRDVAPSAHKGHIPRVGTFNSQEGPGAFGYDKDILKREQLVSSAARY